MRTASVLARLKDILERAAASDNQDPRTPATLAELTSELQQILPKLPAKVSEDLTASTAAIKSELEAVLEFALTAAREKQSSSQWKKLLLQSVQIEVSLISQMSHYREAVSEINASFGKGAAESESLYIRHIVLSGLLTLLVCAQIVLFERIWLIKPITRFSQVLVHPRARNMKYLHNHAQRQDEIGILGKALLAYQNEAQRRQNLAEDEKLHLKQEVSQKEAQQFRANQFRDNIAVILSTLESHALRMQSQSESLADTAAEAEQQTFVAKTSTSETSASIQAVSVSVSELSGTISDIHNQITRAADIVSSANESISNADHKSIELVGRSQAIERVIELIQSVAERTNLLSLNATIEAARAGEVGRGFAVVASEIKALASQTSRATGEIRGELQSVIDASNAIATTIHLMVDSIREIDQIAKTIAASAKNQNDATREIDNIATRTAQTAKRLDKSITGVAGIVSDASKTAKAVQTISEDLSLQAAALRNSVNTYMQTPSSQAA